MKKLERKLYQYKHVVATRDIVIRLLAKASDVNDTFDFPPNGKPAERKSKIKVVGLSETYHYRL